MAKLKGRGYAAVNYPTGMNLGGDPSQALIHSTTTVPLKSAAAPGRRTTIRVRYSAVASSRSTNEPSAGRLPSDA